MSTTTRVLATAVLALLLFVPSGYGAPDIDRSAVDWKTPAEIKWVRNAAGTNEQAVLFGDPGWVPARNSSRSEAWGRPLRHRRNSAKDHRGLFPRAAGIG